MAKPAYHTCVAALLLSCAAAVAPAQAAPVGPRHFHLGYAKHEQMGSRGPHRGRLTALVGDRESGLGFYALPARYRTQRSRRSGAGP